MGLLLLIAGLVLLLNGTTWFGGEEGVGAVLAVVGGLITLIQVIWVLFVASRVKDTWDRF